MTTFEMKWMTDDWHPVTTEEIAPVFLLAFRKNVWVAVEKLCQGEEVTVPLDYKEVGIAPRIYRRRSP